MNSYIAKLAESFEKLPGIGPRQAYRFVYHLLNQNEPFLTDFSALILNLKKNVVRCENCQRFFLNGSVKNGVGAKSAACEICANENRDKSILLVVEKDIDLENIEKAGSFEGQYFVLGGLVPLLGKDISKEIKIKELFAKVKNALLENKLGEVILAFNATSEGDNTNRYVEKILEPFSEKFKLKTTRLGRGLSTGTELEYSDKDTIINSLKNRK